MEKAGNERRFRKMRLLKLVTSGISLNSPIWQRFVGIAGEVGLKEGFKRG